MTKVFYKSWTLWVNFLILVLSLFDSAFFSLFALSESTIAIILGLLVKITAIGNIALRVFMSEAKISSKRLGDDAPSQTALGQNTTTDANAGNQN